MDPKMEIFVFLAYGVGLFFVYFFGRLLYLPLKWAGKLLINSVLGGIFIIIVNLVGGYVGISLPFNGLNALIMGMLGLPGAVGLLLYFNL